MTARTRLAETEIAARADTIDHNGHLARRFWSKVNTDGVCWEWTGATDDQGYGRWKYRDNIIVKPHRIAWALLVGLPPQHLVPDHQCRNPSCVNPDHIEWVTAGENNARGGSASARAARATRCPAGHPYDKTNTICRVQKGRNRRECRICTRAQARIRQQRRKDRLAARTNGEAA